MGPRMREDNGGAGDHEGRPYGDDGGSMVGGDGEGRPYADARGRGGSGMGARSLGSDVLRSE